MSKVYDVIVLGAGPAGLAAGLYAGRSRLSTLVIEKGKDGGQIAITDDIENYPGQIVEGESGPSLIARMTQQCEKFGVERASDVINEVHLDGDIKVLKSAKAEYQSKTVIIATGAFARPIGCKGEKEFMGKGVSYCATCDGAFFRNRTVAVIGGGDVAVEDAVFLSRMCSKVYLIHRRGELRAAKSLQNQLFSKENVEILWNMQAQAIEGNGTVERLILSENGTGKKKELSVQGVFIAVGIQPETKAFEGIVNMEQGYIKAEEEGITSAPGIFAAGDARTKKLRQIVTATADGANAVTSAEQYLSDLKRG